MVDYTIKKGDTFAEIAKAHGTTVQAIEHANPGVNPNNLQIGQVIHLPSKGSPSPPGQIPGSSGGSSSTGGAFVPYHGPASSFPPHSAWASYHALWEQNHALMTAAGHDSAAEIADIKTSIERVAREADFDVRAILAIIMQESGGNVRIATTNNGVRNPGIMQVRENATTALTF